MKKDKKIFFLEKNTWIRKLGIKISLTCEPVAVKKTTGHFS